MSFIRRLLPVLALLMTHAGLVHAADTKILLDIHDDHIAAELTLPISVLEQTLAHPLANEHQIENARVDLASHLQTHLNITTINGQSMAYELGSLEPESPETLRATLFIYSPDDITPDAFVISSDLLIHEMPNHRLQIFLRRDPAEMRIGVEPILLLGIIDHFQSELKIEREFPNLGTRAFAAFSASLQMITSQTISLLLLLLVMFARLEQTTVSAFKGASVSVATFATGISVALIFETHLDSTLLASLAIAALIILLLLAWKPQGWIASLAIAFGAGWVTGITWNNTWFPQGIFSKKTLFLISATTLPALLAIMLLALPALLLLVQQVRSQLLRR